jgi:hypothetical protein
VQDIGEAETEELGSLYSPLLQECVGALLADVDLSSQQGDLQGVDLKQLVSCIMMVWRGCGGVFVSKRGAWSRM